MGELEQTVESTANAEAQTALPESDQKEPEQTQAGDSSQQPGLSWEKIQEDFKVTPEQAAEVLKKQHNMNSFFDRRSKELKAEERQLDGLKKEYEDGLSLLNDPEYIRKIAEEEAGKTDEDVDDVEKRIVSNLKGELDTVKQQQQKILDRFQEQETKNAQVQVQNVLMGIDKDFPGMKLGDESSPMRRMVLLDVATAYGKALDTMQPSEVEQALKYAAQALSENLKNSGYTRIDKTYVEKKRADQAEHVTESGKTNMAGFGKNDDEANDMDTRGWINRIIAPKYKKAMGG